MAGNILVIDDERHIFEQIEDGLAPTPHTIHYASELPQVRDMIPRYKIDLVIVDLNIKIKDEYGNLKDRWSGLDFIQILRNRYPELTIAVLSGYRDVDRIVEATKNGADLYIYKGKWIPDSDKFRQQVGILIKAKKEEDKKRKASLRDLWGDDAYQDDIFKELHEYGQKGESFLLSGEAGLGKEMIPQRIYAKSERFNKVKEPSSIDLSWFKSKEIYNFLLKRYGTGKKNFFRLANQGILYMEGLHKCEKQVQKSLLKAIETGKFLRSNEALNIQFIFDLPESPELLIRIGKLIPEFSAALPTITLLPLRERRSDIPEIIEGWKVRHQYNSLELSDDATKLFQEYHYPGNLTELYKLLGDALANHKKRFHRSWENHILDTESLPQLLFRTLPFPYEDLAYEEALLHLRYIAHGLQKYDGQRGRKGLVAEDMNAKSADNLKKTYIDKYWEQFPALVRRFPIIIKEYKLDEH